MEPNAVFLQRAFLSYFEKISDPRVEGRCAYRLIDVLVISFCAIALGAESFADIERYAVAKFDWLKKYLPLKDSVPSHDTFARVLSLIDPKEIEDAFFAWARDLLEDKEAEKHLSMDGKSIKGTSRTFNGRHRPLHLVSVYSHASGLVLGQAKSTGAGFSEISAIRRCLDYLDLKDALITVDAACSFPALIQEFHERGADYLVPIKKNQKPHYRELRKAFSCATSTAMAEFEEKNRGRVERRTCSVLDATEYCSKDFLAAFPGVRTIAKIQRVRQAKDTRYLIQSTGADGKQSYKVNKSPKPRLKQTTVYYISSRPLSPERCLWQVREHWEIENRLNWVLDIAFMEDACRVRNDQAARNLSALRKIAFNMYKKDPSKHSIKGKMKMSAWSDEFFEAVIFNVARSH